ncbi:ureidoglycolate lyase [Curvivirga aplysinae]|uniref:ureidoglycolate lyase n=1 Tax=Curvivirga aplysinae TaxID=2529852 RepID=UPI0012BBDEDB|nr:ureidoglycolate lyase [Curvivirga aplysinae]MTI10748.1 ureidoglycolate hydrolase [Curvivirga aplysinae]
MLADAPEYIFDPKSKPTLPLVQVPLIEATEESVKGYGCLVDDPNNFEIEITTWPAQGWRKIDAGTGNEAGHVEGIFHGNWEGDILKGKNEAVAGDYILGFSRNPKDSSFTKQTCPRDQVLLWHMNYHPDGGQLFYPLDNKPFVIPAALPGDDLKPEKVVAFWCDGSKGLYIHADIWHEGIFPVTDNQRFLDRQGKVHARVSCDIGEEFGVYLSVPLSLDKPKS